MIKKALFLLIFLLFITPVYAFQSDIQQVCFSPNGRCTEAIVEQIDSAKSDIYIQAYSFTSVPIAKALINAHKRGVKVQAILDKSQKKERYTSATFWTAPLRLDRKG